MPQIINTNIASLTAQRNLNSSQSANQKALGRLSSGLRINSAKDDAAGMAISTRFTSQIRGLNVAIRNVGDGVSLAQTADGALGTITNNLQRVRELSVQSANATNSDVDREALQAEVTQLVEEISRTGSQTAFNGLKLFDGEFNATFQIGANVGETVSFGISELSDKTLGGGKSAGVSAIGSGKALDNGDLVINGVVIGASTAASDSSSTVDAAASAIAKVASINEVSDQTGVEATVLTNVATGTTQQLASGGENSTSGTVVLNGVEIAIATGDVDQAADRAAVVTAINARSAETGVVAVDSGSATGGVNLEAVDGRNIALSFAEDDDNNLTAQSTGLTAKEVTTGGFTLSSMDGSSAVEVSAGTGSLANAGLVEGSFAAQTAAVNSIARSSRPELSSSAGDTGPLAATITGGGTVNLANANFTADNLVFDVTIENANSGFEDTTATVTLDEDFRGKSVDDLVKSINDDLAGNIAAEAFVMDDDKVGFRRTTAEEGVIKLENFTNPADVPGGLATIRDTLGLQATDTPDGTVLLSSETNAVRGGQAGRAELIGKPAVAASMMADADFVAQNYSANNDAQFDLTISGSTTEDDNGTYTIQVDTDFTNASFADFATDVEDAQRILDELNKDIADAGAEGIIEAKFNGAGTRLIFERVNKEAGGDLSIDGYVTTGTTDAADITTGFGFVEGRSNIDTDAAYAGLNIEGSDEKAAGARAAEGGKTIGIDTNSGLISGGYDGGTNDGETFSAFTTRSNATFAGTAAPSDLDFSDAISTFTVSDGTNSVEVTLDAVYANTAEILTSLNSQLAAGGVGVTAVEDGTNAGQINFESRELGGDARAEISGLSAGESTQTGLANGGASGVEGNHDFTYNIGGEDVSVDLRGAAGLTGTDLATFMDSLVGLDASYDDTTHNFTVSATDGTSDLVLVGGDNSALEYLGLTGGTFAHTPEVTGLTEQEAVTLGALDEGDLKINGITISASRASSDTASNSLALSSDKAASGIAIAAAINESADETGVAASVNATVVNGGTSNSGTSDRLAEGDQGTVYVNGVATSAITLGTDSEANRSTAINAINGISGQTGVMAEDAGGYVRLTASDGRNVSVAIDNMGTTFTGSNIGLSASQAGIGEADFSVEGKDYANVAQTSASSVTLTSAKEFSIGAGTNGTEGLTDLGLVAGTYGGSEDGQFLSDIDITTVEGAEAAILAIDNAIATVSSQRAGLGAIQNRLESTVGNLTVTAENLTAANSRILDADFAIETAELSRSQVLQQAGISILAQANASSQQVLSLLQ